LPYCFAFDCDGSLSTSAGPVPISLLAELINSGHRAVIVSASANCKQLNFTHVDDAADRGANLKRVKELYPECDRFIYCSDNPGDDQLSMQQGFEYVHPNDFAAFLVREKIR